MGMIRPPGLAWSYAFGGGGSPGPQGGLTGCRRNQGLGSIPLP